MRAHLQDDSRVYETRNIISLCGVSYLIESAPFRIRLSPEGSMNSCCLLLAILFQMQPLATVSGQILDREGNPLAGALITYKNIGTFDRDYQSIPGAMRTESPRMREGTGRIYKVKTDRKGAFLLIGMDYGVYAIEITGPDGSRVYSGKKTIGPSDDLSSQNVLNVDLSLTTRFPVAPGAETNLAGGKKTKEQLELIHQENVNAAKINRLIGRYRFAVDRKSVV